VPGGQNARRIEELRSAGDMAGLLSLFETSKKVAGRQAAIRALKSMGDGVPAALLDMLGDEGRQRLAAAAIVELGEQDLSRVEGMLDSPDAVRRRGALQTMYFFARYRGVPAAYKALREVSQSPSDLAQSAAAMLGKAEAAAKARNAEIDRQLAKIARAQEHEETYAQNPVMRIYASKRGDQFVALQQIVDMRYAGLRRLIEIAPEAGDPAIVALLALALHQAGGEVVPPVAEALRNGDRKTKSTMLRTLLCLRRAGIAGAAQALEESGITPSEAADRRAAALYTKWIRER
jgi:hypothetical protein